MSLHYIGPLELDTHYEPSFRWASDTDRYGFRGVTISGRIDWGLAWAIHELVANPDRRTQMPGIEGVLEVVWATDPKQQPFNGWYLLKACEIDAERRDSLTDIVPLSISGVHLGSVKPITYRSAVARHNSFDLAVRAVVVQPFWVGDPEARDAFLVEPGAASFTREYDPRTGYDPDAPRLPDLLGREPATWESDVYNWEDDVANWEDDASPVGEVHGRRLRIFEGAIATAEVSA